MADGDFVRRITVSATGENIESTKASVLSLNDATTKLAASNDNVQKSTARSKTSLVDLAAGIYVAKSAYEALAAGSDNASSSMGKATAAITSALGAVLMYVPHKIGEIWQEGIDKLNSYVELNQKAGDLSVEFYQRLTKGATDAKKPADEYLKILDNINKALDRNLGSNGVQNGSAFNTLAEQLKEYGNLSKQASQVSALNNAVTGPEQLKAGLALVEKLLDDGQKLVAFKIAGTILGPEATENLKRNNDYIYQIRKNIEDVNQKDIIKQADIDRAAGMKQALEDAFKYLDSRNKKEVSDWSALGIEIQQLWVNAVTQYAAVLQWLDRIFDRTKDIAEETKNIKPSMWTSVSDYFTKGMSNEEIESQYGVHKMSTQEVQMELARQRLASQMQNRGNVARAGYETQRADDWVSPDKSVPAPKTVNDSTDAIDRAINSTRKHIEAMKAQTEGVGQDVGVLARLKVEHDQVSATQANGGKITQEQADAFKKLKDEAGTTAIALERFKIANDIKRDRDTALLSPQDLQIANQLKGLYPDVQTALQSAEAEQMRFNNLLKDMNTTIRDGAQSFVKDFLGGLSQGKSLVDSLSASVKNLGNSLINGGVNQLFQGNFITGGLMIGGGLLASLFGGDDQEEQQRQQAEQQRQQQVQANKDAQASRQADYNLQTKLTGINTDTIAGQIQAFDLNADKQRADELKAGGFAIVELEKSLAAQRQAIVDKANKAVIKSYQDFLDSVKTGDLSTLSPEDQLKYAQNLFNSDVTKAGTGDQDAINAVTSDAQNLLQLAKAFYASSGGYNDIYKNVIDTITNLMKSSLYVAPADVVRTQVDADPDPEGTARAKQLAAWQANFGLTADTVTGYASGGVVMNGTRGIDSVTAKLAGGEFVTRTSAVNPSTLGALSYINRTGRTPKQNNDEVVSVLTQGFNNQTSVLADKLDAIADRVKRLEDATRQSSNQRRVPGSDKRAA